MSDLDYLKTAAVMRAKYANHLIVIWPLILWMFPNRSDTLFRVWIRVCYLYFRKVYIYKLPIYHMFQMWSALALKTLTHSFHQAVTILTITGYIIVEMYKRDIFQLVAANSSEIGLYQVVSIVTADLIILTRELQIYADGCHPHPNRV